MVAAIAHAPPSPHTLMLPAPDGPQPTPTDETSHSAAAPRWLPPASSPASSGVAASEAGVHAWVTGQHQLVPAAVLRIWAGTNTSAAAEPAAASTLHDLHPAPSMWQPALAGILSSPLQPHGGWQSLPPPLPAQLPLHPPPFHITSPTPSLPHGLQRPAAAVVVQLHPSPSSSSHPRPGPSRPRATTAAAAAGVPPMMHLSPPTRPLLPSLNDSGSTASSGASGRNTPTLGRPPPAPPAGVTSASARRPGRRLSRRAVALHDAARRLFTAPGALPPPPGACSCRGGSDLDAECLRGGAVWWVMGGMAPLGPVCGLRMWLLWEQGIVVVATSRVCGAQRLPPDDGGVPPATARFQILSRILAAMLSGGAYAWAEPFES